MVGVLDHSGTSKQLERGANNLSWGYERSVCKVRETKRAQSASSKCEETDRCFKLTGNEPVKYAKQRELLYISY